MQIKGRAYKYTKKPVSYDSFGPKLGRLSKQICL